MKSSSQPHVGAWIRLLKFHNLVIRQSRTRLAEHCTLAQFDVLAQLQREPEGLTPAELSRHLLVTAGNITGMVDRMTEAGLVSRNRESGDRRTVRIQLTEKGKQLAKAVIPKHTQDIRDSFRSLSATEIDQLRRLLDKLITGLEPDGERTNS